MASSSTAFNFSGLQTAQKSVAVPGTGEQLPNLAVPQGSSLIVRARKSNTQNVYLGSSKANAENHALAFTLAPGEAVSLDIVNASLGWIDADVAAEGVALICEATNG